VRRPKLAGDVVVVADVDFVQAAAAVDQAGFLERGLGGLPSRNLPSPHEKTASIVVESPARFRGNC
jgi:hypothetical protein